LAPGLFRERGEREQVGAGVVEVLGGGGVLGQDQVQDAVELRGDVRNAVADLLSGQRVLPADPAGSGLAAG
jgi:hypothetical protein